MTSKIPSSTTGVCIVSVINSIIEHWVDDDVIVEAVLALGLGSSNPSPMISAWSAYFSASRARSIADGCRRMWLDVGLDTDEVVSVGERAEFKSLVGRRIVLPKLL